MSVAAAAEVAPEPVPEQAPAENADTKPAKAPFGVNAIRVSVAELKDIVGKQGAEISALRENLGTALGQVEELRAQLGRLAAAVGRGDVMTPPLTPEQLRKAHAQGQRLVSLKECTLPNLRFAAGFVFEARQYPLDRMVELIEQGLGAFAIDKG